MERQWLPVQSLWMAKASLFKSKSPFKDFHLEVLPRVPPCSYVPDVDAAEGISTLLFK